MTPTQHTKTELLAGLAAALEIEPDQILIYKYKGPEEGYVTILKNYQKYTGVFPVFIAEEKEEFPDVDINGVSIPADMVPAYTNPKDHSRKDLRELAAFLNIQNARRRNKYDLVKAIDAHKKENSQ